MASQISGGKSGCFLLIALPMLGVKVLGFILQNWYCRLNTEKFANLPSYPHIGREEAHVWLPKSRDLRRLVRFRR